LNREEYIENFLTFIPVLYKRIFKGIEECDITKHQIGLLFYIKQESGNPMNYYGSKMMISKPNLTVLADKLIEEGLLERDYHPNDRRVVILKVTEKGDQFYDEHMKRVKSYLLEKMAGFEDSDIIRLNELMEETKKIFSKLEKE
jgi:DNA-binding MarR family transcriptional regulator